MVAVDFRNICITVSHLNIETFMSTRVNWIKSMLHSSILHNLIPVKSSCLNYMGSHRLLSASLHTLTDRLENYAAGETLKVFVKSYDLFTKNYAYPKELFTKVKMMTNQKMKAN